LKRESIFRMRKIEAKQDFEAGLETKETFADEKKISANTRSLNKSGNQPRRVSSQKKEEGCGPSTRAVNIRPL